MLILIKTDRIHKEGYLQMITRRTKVNRPITQLAPKNLLFLIINTITNNLVLSKVIFNLVKTTEAQVKCQEHRQTQ